MSTIHVDANGLEIVIKGEANQPHAQDLVTMAIVALISEADTHGWEKADIEQHGETEAANQFYAAILSAIARHYAVDSILTEERPTADILEELIVRLREEGRMRQMIQP